MSLGRAHAAGLLSKGMAAAQSGNPAERDEAEYYLEWVTRTDADQDQKMDAWYWLSRIADAPERKRECLENVLAIRPTHPDARRDMAILDGRIKPEEARRDPLRTGAPVVPAAQVGNGEARRFKCPRCGASVVYNPSAGMLGCQFCGAKLDGEGQAVPSAPQELPSKVEMVSDQDWVAAIHTEKGHRWALPQNRVLQCQGCGATVTFAPAHVSTNCAYCGSPYVARITGPEAQDLRQPDGVVPFHFDASAAMLYAHYWLREQARRVFVPDDLADMAAMRAPQALYLPFWAFDIEGSVEWSGFVSPELGGVRVDDIKTVGNLGGIAFGLMAGGYMLASQSAANMLVKKYAGNENKVYSTGAVPVALNDVLVPATRSVPQDVLSRLVYHTQAAMPYHESMIAAWPAEVYSIAMSDASLNARERAVAESNQQIAGDTGYNVDDPDCPLRINRTGLAMLSYKLLLMPVWTASYTYQGTIYRLLINGQTGQVEGGMPITGGAVGKMVTR